MHTVFIWNVTVLFDPVIQITELTILRKQGPVRYYLMSHKFRQYSFELNSNPISVAMNNKRTPVFSLIGKCIISTNRLGILTKFEKKISIILSS